MTELFRDLSAHAAARLGLTPRFAHLDATSFLVHGEYDGGEEPEDGVIQVRKGYSRDQRPDLNQVVLNLMVEHKAGLPVLMEPLSGNASDQGSFRELIDRHVDHLQNAHGFDYVVADSALYSAGHVQDLDEAGTKFVTRVPGTLNEAGQAIQNTDLADLKPLSAGYHAREKISEYGDVKQLLEDYKGQSKVERGFRFLKDPQFVASSLFLESERRIMALLMVMTLCLLVYAALQWRIRQGLKETGCSYPDQKGNPTQRPTARWVFQSFKGIHVLYTGKQQFILNLEEYHRTVVSILGPEYERLYVSHPT